MDFAKTIDQANEEPATNKTRSSRKKQAKKIFEINEDMNDIKVTPNAHKIGIEFFFETNAEPKCAVGAKTGGEKSDLNKYKDEYKELIQFVKTKVSSAESSSLKSGKGYEKIISKPKSCDKSKKVSKSQNITANSEKATIATESQIKETLVKYTQSCDKPKATKIQQNLSDVESSFSSSKLKRDGNKESMKKVKSFDESKITYKETSFKRTPSMDAFQLMMEARKKSIGMNSPGKDLIVETDIKDVSAQKEIKAKRNLALSLMADKKGAKKKRELEEMRDQEIKETLDKRGENFKRMLQQGSKMKVEKTVSERVEEGMKDFEEIFVAKKKSKVVKKRQRDSSILCDELNAPEKKSKLQNKSSNIHTDDSKESTIKAPQSVPKKSKKLTKVIEDEDFLKKLSPSLKKYESVLCYFDKTVTTSAVEESNGSDNVGNSPISKVKSPPKLKNKKLKSKLFKSKSKLKDVTCNVIETNKVIENTGSADNIVKNSDTKSSLSPETSSKDFQRPRRNIRKPVKYVQEDSETSESDENDMFDLKKRNTKRNKMIEKTNMNKENILTIEIDEKVSPLKIINLQSPGQLKCVRSPKTIRAYESSNDKLAPLFMKSLPKPKVDPSVMEARRLFLQSGVPEAMKKLLEKSAPIVLSDSNEFVTVCHIQQKSEPSEDWLWNLPVTKYTPDIVDLSSPNHKEDVDHGIKMILNPEVTENPISTTELFKNLQRHDIKNGLRELKQNNLNFPIYNTFKQLWEKLSSSPKSMKAASQDSGILVNDSTNTTATVDSNLVNSSIWTEKYKPLSSHDIIGNFQAVSSIKKWLLSWKEYHETSVNKVISQIKRRSSSCSDFEISDSESRDSFKSPSRTMIVSGPPGSGKTSSIYAICNEIGINVLEINSSSRRTGKRIISEMHEATQSHKVTMKQNSEQSFSGLFTKNKNELLNIETKSFNQVNKNSSKDFKKKSVKSLSDSPLDSPKNTETNIMSLMLIDDADIVFEEDDGFINALSQLVQTSKRPILFVATDSNCPHLQRFKSDSNIIKFNPLSGKILGPWLDVLILIDCNKIIPNFSSNLLELNKGDVRKSMLQLQYWIVGSKSADEDDITSSPFCALEGCYDEDSNISGLKNDNSNNQATTACNELISKVKKAFFGELAKDCNLEMVWWNLNSVLNHHNSDSKSSEKDLENIYKYIDTYSVISVMQYSHEYNNCTIGACPPWKKTVTDSVSESEDMTMYKSHIINSDNLYQYMYEHSSHYISDFVTEPSDNDNITHIESLDIRAQERRNKVYEEFSHGISLTSQLDRNSLSMDYMSVLRCISRSEKSRSSNNMKRNNRFHNYLNTLNIMSNENILNNACKVLSD